ncbi:MAG: transcription repressor NadR [Clostridia bacterium]|nr:transcription repressor NadR [Oscillospiraceae bacterium]MBQ7960058.1 transcription repressor NadR [Clostridia bacterium]
MRGEERREKIRKMLLHAEKPISASCLAEKFGVSRQIIVKDIAKLRETGEEIISLSRGYVIRKSQLFERVFKVIHSDDDTEKELNLMVDLGGTVVDVFVYHKVYGVVRADMGIKSRSDVSDFLSGIKSGKSSLLKNVTSGYHYHTVTAEKAEALEEIEKMLTKEGFLAPLQEFEPPKLSGNI